MTTVYLPKTALKTSLVLGAGGFIGHHLVKRLKSEGAWVRGVDLKRPRFETSEADDFVIGDLRDTALVRRIVDQPFDEVWQLAADMGGAGFVFTGDNDADILHNSAMINLNVADACWRRRVRRVFYASSACIYPERNQLDPDNPDCAEDTAYPADPDSEYGWEKLFSERLWLSYARNKKLAVRIARFHNVFGPLGSWNDGREKAPAAMCRKVAEADDGGQIEVWGDGEQTRSFLHIDEALEGMVRLMRSDVCEPINIGSDEMVSINKLVAMIAGTAGKAVGIKHVPGPLGVRGRNSDNRRIEEVLGWRPEASLMSGLHKTYTWIAEQVEAARSNDRRA